MIGHEDRLSVVDHLDELRTRLIVCAVAFGVVFGLCFWQNHALLKFINTPLAAQTTKQVQRGEGLPGEIWKTEQGVVALAHSTKAMAQTLSEPSARLPPATRAALSAEVAKMEKAIAGVPRVPSGYKPTTIGVGEPFTTTLTVTLYFALLISLPLFLFELYGFVMPAFTPSERRVARPMLLAVPFLFALGAAFGYYVVLPAAVHFFQNFNASEFNILVQAGSFYKLAVTVLIAMGLIFQVPVAILGLTAAGVVTPKQLRKGRRYAVLASAAVAAFLPGDLVTLLLETIPLYLLYEVSILLAAWTTRRRARRERREAAAAAEGGGVGAMASGSGADPGGAGAGAGSAIVSMASANREDSPYRETLGGEQSDRAVREMLDHIDPDLGG